MSDVILAIAIISSVIFGAKCLLMIVGAEFDFEFDDGGLFSINSIAAFFMAWSWSTLALLAQGYSEGYSIGMSILFALVCTFVFVRLFIFMRKSDSGLVESLNVPDNHEAIVTARLLDPKKPELGEIKFEFNDRFYTLKAKSIDKACAKGDFVYIQSISNDVASVSSLKQTINKTI